MGGVFDTQKDVDDKLCSVRKQTKRLSGFFDVSQILCTTLCLRQKSVVHEVLVAV